VGVSGRILRAGKAASFFKIHRETLANLSITGHLRCFSDQPVAEIVQCGEPISHVSENSSDERGVAP
jgi:hypothetical protein